MTIESATYISQLNATNPAPSDAKSEGDDHLRMIKSTIKATWPNLTAAPVTPTTADLNTVANAATTGASAFNVVNQVAGANNTLAANTAYVATAVANSVFTASLPAQAGNAGKVITTDGNNASWSGVKTVGGVALLGSGDIGTIDVVHGGTGVTTSTGSGANVLSISPVLVTPNIGVAVGSSFNSITALSTNYPAALGAQAAGASTAVSREDHVHPLQTSVSGSSGSCTGNAATATTAASCSGNAATATTAAGLAATNWTISEVAGVLYFKYGGTAKASLDSTGLFKALNNVAAYTTP